MGADYRGWTRSVNVLSDLGSKDLHMRQLGIKKYKLSLQFLEINTFCSKLIHSFDSTTLLAEYCQHGEYGGVRYRFQGTFYCPKCSKKCVCILSTFYSQ